MEILNLQTFVHLVHYQNFSQVAKKMNVSQPTVTVRIKALEEELNVALIIRAGRKIKITPAGKIFYDFIERSLRVLQDGMELVNEETEAQKEHLNIAGTSTVCFYFLPALLADYYNHFQIEYSLYTGHTWEVLEMLEDQIIDIGFISSSLKHPDILIERIYQDEFYLVTSPENPLAHYKKLEIIDIKDEPLITYEKGFSLNYRIESLFREEGIQSNTIMELKYVNSIKKMVVEGNGIAFLPLIAIKNELENNKLIILPLTLSRPLTRNVHLAIHRQNINKNELRLFLNIFKHFLERNRMQFSI